MSSIDRLKEKSRQRRGAAVSDPLERERADDPPPADPDGAPSPAREPDPRSDLSEYRAFWIGQFEALKDRPPPAVAAAVRDALRDAPAAYRPTEEDARLFAAVGRDLSCGDVLGCLRVRAAESAAEVPPDPAAARFWVARLGRPGSNADPSSWSARCREVARAAEPLGHGLPAPVTAALAAHPGAALGYLNCAALAARASAPSTGATDSDPAAAPLSPPSPLTSIPPPAGARATGSGVGLALGGVVGGLAAGVVNGFKAGLDHTFKIGAPPSPPRFSPAWFRQLAAAHQQDAGARELQRAAAESERALAEFASAARQLRAHPQLSSFWREVDRQAESRFAGARAGVLQEMAGQRLHPLRLLFERQARDDPDVALHHQRALSAFERVKVQWDACALAHRERGQGWAPSPEQSAALREACQKTPAAHGQPSLVEQAERLMRSLAQAVNQAFRRAPAPGAGRTPSP